MAPKSRGAAFALQNRLAAREKTHVFGYVFALRDCVAENVSFPRLRSPRGAAFALQTRLAARGQTHVFGYEFAVRGGVAENVSQ